jgi:hypothetical protein
MGVTLLTYLISFNKMLIVLMWIYVLKKSLIFKVIAEYVIVENLKKAFESLKLILLFILDLALNYMLSRKRATVILRDIFILNLKKLKIS